MIKFEPDAMCLQINARYRALYDVVGNIKYMLSRLLEILCPNGSPSLAPFAGQKKWGLVFFICVCVFFFFGGGADLYRAGFIIPISATTY